MNECLHQSYTTTPLLKAVLSFYPCAKFTAPWTGPQALLQSMPDFPQAHIVFAWAHTLSDRNPDVKQFPDGSIDWGMDALSPRVGWYLQNAKQGTLWSSLLTDDTRRLADPYENRTAVPTFIIHGDQEYITPVDVSREMIARLNGWGVECGLIEVEGHGSGFDIFVKESDPEWKYILPGLEFLERHVFINE